MPAAGGAGCDRLASFAGCLSGSFCLQWETKLAKQRNCKMFKMQMKHSVFKWTSAELIKA